MRALIAALASLVLLHPALACADTVHDALEDYALYQHDVSVLLDLDVNGAEAINAAVARLSRHNPLRVSRGWIAYGALTAAQSPAFAAGVERSVRSAGRAQVLIQLRGDVTYARREPAGASQAIQLILSAASADSARVAAAGARYDNIARTSRAAWITSSDRRVGLIRASTRLTPGMRDRLRVGALAARPMTDVDQFGGRGLGFLAGREANALERAADGEQRGYENVTDRMLTLGALVVAGAADSERSRVSALLDEPLTQQCLDMQRLQLRQCLSVSHDASERAYCLGRHGLTGPGSCFSAMVR